MLKRDWRANRPAGRATRVARDARPFTDFFPIYSQHLLDTPRPFCLDSTIPSSGGLPQPTFAGQRANTK